MSYAVGIDLGGTAIKYGLVSPIGEIVHQGTLPSYADTSAERVIQQIISAAQECIEYGDSMGIALSGIGIGSPGIVDSSYRVILGGAENIVGWSTLPLAEIVEEATMLSVSIENDANLMGLGEQAFGAARGYQDVLFITVGTGIGGAIIIDGKLYGGYQGRGAELGHTPLIANGIPCACGSKGCLEAYGSTSALIADFKQNCQLQNIQIDDEINGKLLIKLYHLQHPIAQLALHNHCDLLGHGIAGFINVLAPQCVVIGGGISESGEFYLELIRQSIQRYAIRECAENTRVCAAQLGNKAGIVGAAQWSFTHNPHQL